MKNPRPERATPQVHRTHNRKRSTGAELLRESKAESSFVFSYIDSKVYPVTNQSRIFRQKSTEQTICHSIKIPIFAGKIKAKGDISIDIKQLGYKVLMLEKDLAFIRACKIVQITEQVIVFGCKIRYTDSIV